MTFHKAKALENALKFLSQGKTAQAIAEYQQILRNDSKDQATLMTVGDLYARQGDMAHAIEYFERLAQVYLTDGFNSKAIAIYKKIAKLAPAELPPLERLADLYVQQGVLSEARPLFLQIAEAHLKANRGPKAVEVLRRLLAVEPENPRVQMRLAELYNAMGQKKEAAQTYFAYAQRLAEHGDAAESQKLIDRALELEPNHGAAQFLKAKTLAAAQKDAQAITLLESHADADAGGEVTQLLLNLYIRTGQIESAADRARNQLVRGNSHYGMLLRVADMLIDSDQTSEALPLLRELRDPMIDVGEHDKFLKSLTRITEKLPDQTEPLEMLADFCRHTSDPFHLTGALTKLVDISLAQGDKARAETLLEELVDRNKNDERLVSRLNALREGRDPSAIPEPPRQEARIEELPSAEATRNDEAASSMEAPAEEAAAATPAVEEPALDEETRAYIAQALTDVDLFSSYGLTQKAAHLLENVLQRAPRHTPTLERLLDMYLGAGNDRRTAELAARLEQIHKEAGNTPAVERFAELRQRFQKVAGLSTEELLSASTAEAASALVAETHGGAAHAEFEIPVEPLEPEVAAEEIPASPAPVAAAPRIAPIAPGEELDLSDEWEAMVLEVEEPERAEVAHSSAPTPVPQETPAQPEPEPESPKLQIEVDATDADGVAALGEEPAGETLSVFEIAEIPGADSGLEEPVAFASALEIPEPAAELAEEIPSGRNGNAKTAEEFVSELAAELDDFEPHAPQPTHAPQAADAQQEMASAAQSPAKASAEAPRTSAPTARVPVAGPEDLNQLAEVFQEFRNDMGELGQEQEEDLETHYNLGIAYREMGLLEEAIGEFQKVANAVQKGRPFPYAMNCATLLGLTFLEKGEPKIAATWYERALEVPGLDPETILALRYDLAVALEMAGEAEAALDTFRRVYAVNIEYRDVADHIAALQHQ